jgi:hypothetical protein
VAAPGRHRPPTNPDHRIRHCSNRHCSNQHCSEPNHPPTWRASRGAERWVLFHCRRWRARSGPRHPGDPDRHQCSTPLPEEGRHGRVCPGVQRPATIPRTRARWRPGRRSTSRRDVPIRPQRRRNEEVMPCLPVMFVFGAYHGSVSRHSARCAMRHAPRTILSAAIPEKRCQKSAAPSPFRRLLSGRARGNVFEEHAVCLASSCRAFGLEWSPFEPRQAPIRACRVE